MNRRDFVQKTATLTTASVIPFNLMDQQSKKMKNIGIQLFSLPFLLENNFRESIQLLSQMGYKEVELYGPFPFSAEVAKASWKAITPTLGFSGSGFFGHTAKEVKNILKEYKIKATATHTDLETLETKVGELGEIGAAIGFNYAGIATIPEEKRQNLDGYKKMADTFN